MQLPVVRFTFRLVTPVKAIGFVDADTLEHAFHMAAYLWRRDHHTRKNAAGVEEWYDVLEGALITYEKGAYVYTKATGLIQNTFYKI